MTKTLFIVDMQNDFIQFDGKLRVPKAKDIEDNILELLKKFKENYLISLGSMDRHFLDDLELKRFPEHCMNNSRGQELVPTIRNIFDTNILYIKNKIGTMGRYERATYSELITDIACLEDCGLIIFEKQTIDVFTNPHIEFVLDKLNITEVYVCGVATEYCVKKAVEGFLDRGIKTNVVLDAVKGIDRESELKTLAELSNKGAIFTNTNEVLIDLENGCD